MLPFHTLQIHLIIAIIKRFRQHSDNSAFFLLLLLVLLVWCKNNLENLNCNVLFFCLSPNHRLDDFLSTNNELLCNISRENKICFLMGDFNINLINYQNHHLTGQFLDGMYSNMFFLWLRVPRELLHILLR